MSAYNFESLSRHVGHKIVCVVYGGSEDIPPVGAGILCETCHEILLDYDNPGEDEVDPIELLSDEELAKGVGMALKGEL